MKRALVRGLWGNVLSDPYGTTIRGSKVAKDIEAAKQTGLPVVVYTMGTKNHEWLTGYGFDSRLISNDSIIWDMERELYRHKLQILQSAIEDFDEIVFLDWDCVPRKKFNDGFWQLLGKKESFQANLFQYRTKKCLWRDTDWRKVCNGGFIYIRDKSIPDKFIQNWDELKEWQRVKREARERQGKRLRFREKCLTFDDEPAMSKYVDDTLGGWKGVEAYWEHFEPMVCNLRKKSAFSETLNSTKTEYFRHML